MKINKIFINDNYSLYFKTLYDFSYKVFLLYLLFIYK